MGDGLSPEPLCRGCAYETERLVVRDWRAIPGGPGARPGVVAAILTAPVTRELPDPWQGDFTLERAQAWTEERDREGTTLLALDRSSQRPVGLLVLFESDAGEGVEVRVGYLLAETAWGQGFATELLRGFADWCRGQAAVTVLAAGVRPDHRTSRRVLEKAGFRSVSADGRWFELRLQ